MILVTGASGTMGREVVRALTGHRVRVLVRDPARLREVPAHVQVVRGDYGDSASLIPALTGVSSAFLVTNRVTHEDDAAFVGAARACGVGHVVKLSAAAVTDSGADDLITRWQRGTELLLRGSGLGWTLLRPRAFMSNTLSWAPSVRTGRAVRTLFVTARNACVDPRDVAEVAARALTGEGHAGRAYTLTGPRALTPTEQAAELGRQLGRQLAVEELSLDAARTQLRRRHPPAVVEALIDSACRQREETKAAVSPTVAELLGRPARSYTEWVGDHLGAFRTA
ncbi:NAD(P)H-binding protein [Streptomyces sp. NPDC050264]|uniref:NAD(P)H-binding protein n=1 Tax=Streptomyces sp. NPDC050264 TaxID=3155038 RepID=UPI0034281063